MRGDKVQRRITSASKSSKKQAQPTRNQHRWHQLDGSALASEVASVVRSIESGDDWRRWVALRNLRRTDARPEAAYGLPLALADTEPGELRLRISQSMIETFVADVCGRQRPKPQFLTTGADWGVRRKARKLDRFVFGVLSQPQGQYPDTWGVLTAALEDALRWTAGGVKIYADTDRVRVERVFAHDILVDPREGAGGDPRNLFQLHAYDRDLLLAEFPDHESEIMAAEQWSHPEAWLLDESAGNSRVADQVRVIEAWCLPREIGRLSGEPRTEPGRHVVVCGEAVLVDEEWSRPYFPFTFLRWTPDPVGFWGTSLVDEVWELETEANEHAIRMQERQRLLSGRRAYVQRGTIDPEKLAGNDAELIIEYDGPTPPIVEKVDPFNDSDIAWLSTLRQLPFELRGISVQAATGRKDPGITSGAAIRTVADLGSQRQLVRARRLWEMPIVDIARKVVDAVSDLAASRPGFSSRYAGRGFVEEIQWSDVELREEEYQISVAPASSLPQDPSGRLQTAQELFQAGLVNGATFKRLLDWPDLESEQQRESAEYEYLEWVIDRFLDATDAELREGDVYVPPEGFFTSLPDVIGHVAQAYFQAKRQGAPEENLGLLSRYIDECQVLLQAQQPPPPPPQAPPGMPGMPMPGAQ